MNLKRLLLLASLSASAALATTLTVNGIDGATGLQNSLWINENGTNTQLFFAGGIDITVAGYSRLVYCVDLMTNINVPGTYNTQMDFSNSANLKRIGWLMQNEWPSSNYTGSTLQIQGAAFQLAIWDIMMDSGDGFLAGAGKVTQSTDTQNPTNSAVLTAAAKYETDSFTKTSTYGIVYHNTMTSSPFTVVQTLMGRNATDGGPSPTPEPGAIVLFGSGLALIALSQLRRKRHTK
jgi:hypothetical protein